MNKTAIVIACLAVIGIGFAVNVLYVVYNQTDNFLNGYDHPVIPVLLDLYNRYHPFADDYIVGGHERALNLHTWFSLSMSEIFGLSVSTLFVVQAIAYFLILAFAFLLGRELIDDSTAGWLAAAILSVTPLCYGLLRTYTYWPYMLAFYFGVVLMTFRYQRSPSLKRAVLIGLLFALMTAFTYDRTSRYLVIFNGYTFVGLAFAERIVAAKLQRSRIIIHAILMFALSTSELYLRHLRNAINPDNITAKAFWSAFRGVLHFFNPLTLNDYRNQAVEDTIVSAPWHSTLPSYFSAWFFHGMGPVVFLLFFVCLIAAFFFMRSHKRLMWWILAIVLIVILSVVPRKAPWFSQFLGALFIVLSAASLVEWLKYSQFRYRTVVVTVILSLILGQYMYLSFVRILRVPPWATPIPHANAPNCRSTVFRKNPETEHMRAEAFIARYRELYDNESLRLVPLYYYTHPNVLEFYLRTQTPQISLHNVDDFQTIDVLFWMWHPDSKIDKRILKRTYDQGNRSLLEQYLVDDWRAAYQGKYKKDAPAETVAAFREKISSARLERLTDNNLLLLWK